MTGHSENYSVIIPVMWSYPPHLDAKARS